MKKAAVLIVGGVLIIGGGVYLTSASLARNYLSNRANEPDCQTTNQSHKITIANNTMTPHTVRASLCDTLIVTNTDPLTRRIAFGEHDQHVTYNGVTETMLPQGQSFSVMLNQTGTFKVHDHFDKHIASEFTVSEQ